MIIMAIRSTYGLQSIWKPCGSIGRIVQQGIMPRMLAVIMQVKRIIKHKAIVVIEEETIHLVMAVIHQEVRHHNGMMGEMDLQEVDSLDEMVEVRHQDQEAMAEECQEAKVRRVVTQGE
jgi:hypothetical protein